jgi:acetyl-CoA C-acetyltransferase
MMDSMEARIPVIVGVGQLNDRPKDDVSGLDTLQLMKAALERADGDAGGGWIGRIELLDVVDQMSWPTMTWPSTERIAPALAAALGIVPARLGQTPDPSGDGPVRLLNEAANRIALGEVQVVAIVGGEALRTGSRRAALAAQQAAEQKARNPDASSAKPEKKEFLREVSKRNFKPLLSKYGLIAPSDIYPLYENACRAKWGQSLAEAQLESARIWAGMSDAAVENPDAWLPKRCAPEEILTPSPDNRPISFPYNKLMVANNNVNQGAALIVTSLAAAKAAGIAESRLVYIGRGAASHEADDFLARDRYDYSPGMEVSLTRALGLNGLTTEDLDYVEFYSCFPCIPKMARRYIGLPVEKRMSVYGGLTFGGAPIGNCMTHAAAVMTLRLRERGTHGLLFGNGGFATHNHALVLTRKPVDGTPASYNYQAEADAKRGPTPNLVADYVGPAKLETYAVPYDRNGAPRFAIILALTPSGERVLCRVPAEDKEGLEFLTSGRSEPVGTLGQVVAGPDDYIFWKH